MLRRNLLVALTAALGIAGAHAQGDYPSKPVRMVVGFAAGGPTDQVARIVAERMAVRLKQPFIVENRPGGNGALAAQTVLGSAPDGYTLLVGTSGALTVSPALMKTMSYEPRALSPVGLLAGYPYALVVHPSLPVNDVQGLVDYLRKTPKSTFASAGPGSVNHLAGELFASLAKVELIHVPFKGDAPSLVDLMGGRVLMGFNTLATAMPQVKAGKLKALAVTSESVTPLAPGLQPMTTQGYPGFVVEPWNGLFGPSGLPQPIASKLNLALREVLSEPDVQARIAETGQYPLIDTPEGVRVRMREQSARWVQVVREANIQPE